MDRPMSSEQKWETVLEKKIDAVIGSVITLNDHNVLGIVYAFQGINGPRYALNDQGRDSLRDAVACVLKHPGWGSQISEEFAHTQIIDLLKRLLGEASQSNRDRCFADFSASFFKSIARFAIFVPIFGIAMTSDSWKIGKIELGHVTPQVLDRWFGQLDPSIANMIYGCLQVGVYAISHVEAEATKAKEMAFEETRRAIDLLRFSVTLRPDTAHGKVMIALEEEINLKPDNRLISIIPVDLSSFQVHWRNDSENHADWLITPELIQDLEGRGIGRLSLLLRKPYSEVSDFEKSLLRSIHWFADCQFQFERENKLLSLITSIETLLTPRDGNPIGTAIAEAVALICATDLKDRKRVKSRVKELYKQRSAVSHGGHKAAMDSDLAELLALVQKLVLWMIGRLGQFKSTKDLFEWIEDQKLGGDSHPT